MMLSTGRQGLHCSLMGHFALWICGGLTFFAQGQRYTYDEETLTDDLFTKYSYNKKLRPYVDISEPTIIYMTLTLISIVDLQEKDQILKFSAKLRFNWEDPNLSWEPSAYNYIEELTYPQSELWLPDVTILNSVESLNLHDDRNAMRLCYPGEVRWRSQDIFSTTCQIDITYYPFDTQNCQVIFSTVTSYKDEVLLTAFLEEVDLYMLAEYTDSATWHFLNYSLEPTTNTFGSRSALVFNLHLKRRVTFYVISLILPVMFLAVTSAVVFAVPSDTGEKMGTSISVLLAYAVYISVISDQMPKSSLNVSLLSVYVTSLLGITAMAVILSALFLNLRHRDDDVHANPPSACLQKTIFVLRRLMFLEGKQTVVSPLRQANGSANKRKGQKKSIAVFSIETESQHAPGELANESTTNADVSALSEKGDSLRKVTWRTVSSTLDSFFLRCFSFLIFATTTAFLVALKVGGALD